MNKFYLTTAIPYVNAKPHLGHALEFIEGDAVARFRRARGDDVFFVSGADENSLKNVRAAEREGILPRELCDRNTKAFVDLAKDLNISFDRFMRSSSEEHFASSQDLWQRCAAAGDIYKKAYRGLYCVGCEMFYARDELTETGECFEHPGQKLEEVEEENYFFRLSKYQTKLEELITSDAYRIVPETRKNEALQFIRRGLEDFSVSRSKARSRGWGVPVPNDSEQIMYVWFDALNVYRSAAPERWPADLHIIGKGILRFHAIYWPAILLSAGEPLPKELFVHGYVTVEGQKMSKSVGNVVDPAALVAKYGADAVRYYFLREIPSYDDGDYGEQKFKERYNADLANGLGNLVSRILKMAAKDQVRLKAEHFHSFKEWVEKDFFAGRLAQVVEKFEFNKALDLLWLLAKDAHHPDFIRSGFDQYYVQGADTTMSVSAMNILIQEQEPFKEKDPEKRREKIYYELGRLQRISLLLEPFLPETAQKIMTALQQGSEIKSPLFPRIA